MLGSRYSLLRDHLGLPLLFHARLVGLAPRLRAIRFFSGCVDRKLRLPLSWDRDFVAGILNQIEMPGGVARVTQQLTEARRRDPKGQLWPEIIVTVMGYDHSRAGEMKLAVEIMKLDVTAYPESPDATASLSDAYLADGQKDLARQNAEKALALLASDTKNSEARRNEIRESAPQKLKQLGAAR